MADVRNTTQSGINEENFFGNIFTKDGIKPSKQNFVLNLVLPFCMVKSSIEDAKENIKEEKLYTFYGRRLSPDVQLLAGSSTDGLALPEITHINGRNSFTEGQDEDVLFLLPYLMVDEHHRRAFAKPVQTLNQPGYIHLEFKPEWLYQRDVPCYQVLKLFHENFNKPEEYVDNNGFVLRRQLTGKLRRLMRQDIRDKKVETEMVKIHGGRNVTVQYSYHGPAITASVYEHTYNIHHSKDYVIGLPHPKWPEEAMGWQKRSRHWPPKTVIRSVVKSGCHVIPKAHKARNDPREFILSFGLASRIIAHSLNIAQFRCYKLFKYLFQFCINKVKRGLSTYHCKQTMFWLCEKRPQEHWMEDNPYECLQWLLEELGEFLTKRYIPNYFTPANNTIDHLSEASVAAVRDDVQNVKTSCWSIILELTETKRFPWLSKDVSLSLLLSPCLSSIRLTQRLMSVAVLQFTSKMLDKGEIAMVFQLLGIDTYRADYLDMAIQRLMDGFTIELDSDTFYCLKGFLATLYHELAMKHSQEEGSEKEHRMLKDKSRTTFEEVIHMANSHIWAYGEYYNLLDSTDDHRLILDHFGSHVLPESCSSASLLYQGGIYTTVNGHNRLTVDPYIRDYLEGDQVPTTAFLFFQVIQALLTMYNTSGENSYLSMAFRTVKQFDTWAKYKCSMYPEQTDEHVYALLALSYNCIGSHHHSEKYSKLAESYGMAYNEENADIMLIGSVVSAPPQFGRERRKLLRKPYVRLKGQCVPPETEEFILKYGEVRVNQYLHC